MLTISNGMFAGIDIIVILVYKTPIVSDGREKFDENDFVRAFGDCSPHSSHLRSFRSFAGAYDWSTAYPRVQRELQVHPCAAQEQPRSRPRVRQARCAGLARYR